MAPAMTAATVLRHAFTPAFRPHKLFCDFLLPSSRVVSRSTRYQHASIVTSSATPATEPMPESLKTESTAKRRQPLSEEQRKFLDSALRVNQAGELAATLIYIAQTPPLIKAHPHLRPLMKYMYDQEAGHFSTFNTMLAKHRIRPTAMYPIWQFAATALGWTTAMMGREAAMACTEAVEKEIGGHYNGQVRVLLQWVRDMEGKGKEVGEEVKELVKTLKRIRDEELEHLDHAVEHDAKQAEGYGLLTNVIRSGCKGAIWISEKI